MTFHELIYKLVGTTGTVLELGLGGKASVAEVARNALPELTWMRIEDADIDVDDQENHLVLADLRTGLLQHAQFGQLLDRTAIGVLLLPGDDEEQLADTLKEADQMELHPESLTPVSIDGNEIVAIVFRKSNTGFNIDHRARRALTELAVVRFARDRERNLVSRAQQLQEERDKLRDWKLQAENLEQTVMRHQDRLEELARELREREAKHAQLERQLSRCQAQLEAQQLRATSLRRSFSYRFGNLFALAARSPRDFALLPFRAIRMIAGATVRRARRGKQQSVKTEVIHTPSPRRERSSPASASPRENEQLNAFLDSDTHAPQSETATALIGHALTHHLVNPNKDIAVLHPNTWHNQLDRFNTKSVIIDSYRNLAHSPWQGTLEGASLGYPGHLVDLLEHCRSKGVASILMLTGNVREHAALFDVAPLFSHVIAPTHADITPLVSSLDGHTTILRSAWPVSTTNSAHDLNSRRKKSSGYLLIENGAVFVKEKENAEPRLIASECALVESQEAFGLPLLLDSATDIDLRVFELLSKGAIPVGPEEHLLPHLEHYRFVAARSPAKTIADVDHDGALCLDVARTNVLAAATHDTVARTLADVAGIGGTPNATFHLNTNLAAIIILKEEKEILLALNSLERQYTLPSRLIVLAEFDANPVAIKALVARQLDPAIETKVTMGRGDWRGLTSILDRMPEDTWVCVVDARCHYGAAYFSRAAALAASGLSTTYGLLADSTDSVEKASLVMNRASGLRLGGNLGDSTNNLADSIPRPLVPDYENAGTDFIRPDHAKSL